MSAEQRRRALRLLQAGDEQLERPAALAREVAEVEVLDVDPLGAEPLRDPGQDARPVGDVDDDALQRAAAPRG